MTRRLIGGTFTHLFHGVYFVLITWRMYHHLKEAGMKPSNATFAVGIIFTIFGFLIQCALCFASFKKRTEIWKWIPGLLFIVSSLAQYGITLHVSHLNAKTADAFTSKNSTEHKAHSDCGTLEVVGDNTTYIILLTTLPMMVITNMAYALTDEDENEDNTLFNAYAALDVIDMAELMFADVGCYQDFSTGWLAFFYIALIVAALLIPFGAYGLEQYKKDGPKTYDKLNTSANLICNDLFLLILRINTMAQTGKAYFGLIFAIKEGLSCMLRIRMLLKNI